MNAMRCGGQRTTSLLVIHHLLLCFTQGHTLFAAVKDRPADSKLQCVLLSLLPLEHRSAGIIGTHHCIRI